MDNVKLGIVGVGNMGFSHLACIYSQNINGLTVTAACDIDEDRLKIAAEKFSGIACFKDYNEMLQKADIDAVLIAVPHPLHADMAVEALRCGKHILVEKPIDITVSKAKALNEAAEKSNKVFSIMFNWRTNSLFKKAKEIVESGELGEIKRSNWIITNWYRTQSYYNSNSWRATWIGEGGGVLLNQAPHNLDIWQWICGMPETVTAFCSVSKYHNIEVEDEAIIHTTYKKGATGLFITSTGEAPGTNRLEIMGTLGKIIIEDGLLKHWRLKDDERVVSATSPNSFQQIESEYTEYTPLPDTSHKGILQNFTNAILFGETLLAPGYDGINELTISNAAYLSSWQNNKKINIPFNTDEFDCLLEAKRKSSCLKQGENSKASDTYNSRWQVHW